MTRKGTSPRARKRVLLPFLGMLGFLLIWEGIVRVGIASSLFLPPPSKVFHAFVNNMDTVAIASLVTLRDVGIGWAVGVALAIPCGLGLGSYRIVYALVAPVILLASPIPIVTFLPLFITWFGLNLMPVFGCGVIAGFFPTFMATVAGVRGVDVRLIEVGKNFGASEWQLFSNVILPASSPQIATGMRLSIQLCFLVVPVAEMIMGDIGLGGLIWRSADLFRIDLLVAGQISLGLMGLAAYRLFDRFERTWLRWLPVQDNYER